MIDYDVLDALGGVNEAYISAANMQKKPARHIRWGTLAACLAAVLLIGGVFTAAAEAKEYNTAAAFFAEHGLSAAGLSRSEIKKVYRDITTGHFTYDKTAEVIVNAVPGYELPAPEALTPEDLETLWNRGVWFTNLPASGYGYKTDCVYKENPTLGFETLEKSTVECYLDGRLQWTADFDAFSVEGCAHTSLGTAVWGSSYAGGNLVMDCPLLARVDDVGNVLWVRQLKHDFRLEFISAVLDGADEKLAVISRGNLNTLCFSLYDKNGEPVSSVKTETGSAGIVRAAKLGDGYLVQLDSFMQPELSRIVKLDAAGNMLNSFTYTAEDCDYYITDMLEFGGHVYLSAYAVPKQTDEGGRNEIANILDFCFEKEGWYVSPEELTPKLRENYTAVLLVCDPEGGEPRTFYAVNGALGGEMRLTEAGELEWDTQTIESAFFSPATNSFTIGGTCRIVRYTFAEDGKLKGQETTDEIVGYHR